MLNLQPDIRKRLAGLADSHIRRALTGVAGMAAPLDAREALGTTVSLALPATADAWRPVLRPDGLTARVFGVFSLGAPIVTFADEAAKGRDRLADLLVVVEDRTGQRPERRAALVRTKLAVANDTEPDGLTARIGAGRLAFRFDDAAYDSRLRDLQMEGAEGYKAEIELPSSAPDWRLTPLAGPDGRRASLGAWLVAMACGRRGREAGGRETDDWSRTVEELRDRTARATMQGLTPDPRLRSLATHRGALGSGFVVFEDRTGLGVEQALASGPPPDGALAEAPLSLVHVIFQ